MNPSTVSAIAILPVLGLLIDVVIVHRRKAVLDHFLRWWYHLSDLQIDVTIWRLSGHIKKCALWVFGPRLFSLKAFRNGLFFLVLSSAFGALLSAPSHFSSVRLWLNQAILLLAVHGVPAYVGFLLAGCSIRMTLKVHSGIILFLSFLFGLGIVAFVLAIQAAFVGTIIACGLSIAFESKIPAHTAGMWFVALSLAQKSASMFFIPIVLGTSLLHLIYCCVLFVGIVFARCCIFVERIFANIIESAPEKPFTSIGATLSACWMLGLFAADRLPGNDVIKGVVGISAQFREQVNAEAGGWVLRKLRPAPNQQCILYMQEVAREMKAIENNKDSDAGRAEILEFLKQRR